MNAVFQLAANITRQASREKPADALLRTHLKTARLSRRDATLVADLVFAFERWRGLLDSSLDAAAQLRQAHELDQRFHKQPESFTDAALRQCVPAWLEEEVTVTTPLLRSLQAQPTLWLRARREHAERLTRRLDARPWTARKGLQNADHKRQPGRASPNGETVRPSECLQYLGRADLFRTPEFQAGEFEIQDISSQIVSLLCSPKPGETWWDACAGEGGKTLHLSDLMDNKGLIWATDRAEWRLKRLKQRAARAGVFNYQAALWDGGARLPTKKKFDGVLVDAPCSGVGTWQRNPHARWTTTREDVEELARLQESLLLNAATAVKPGGRLIYSVCTLTRAETDAVADRCSTALSGFEPLPLPALPNGQQGASARKWIWPQDFAGNGMFVAAWRRVAKG